MSNAPNLGIATADHLASNTEKSTRVQDRLPLFIRAPFEHRGAQSVLSRW